ncbi:MAG: signal peptidase II [Anaerotignum sp.]|nr:signal peptidase II [Anaerotignum sp.]
MKEILTAFTVFGLDAAAKKWANENLPLNGSREIVRNRLYFRHIKNSGIAYNRFSGKRKGILLFTGSLLAYYTTIFIHVLLGRKDRKFGLPLALVLGGGWGNFLERAKCGKVTDFIYIPVEGWNAPIFNPADVAVWIGAAWLAIVSFGEK